MKNAMFILLVLFSAANAYGVSNGATYDELVSQTGHFPEMKQVVYLETAGAGCTGFFVNANTMITARHCLVKGFEHFTVNGVKPLNYFYIHDDQSCQGEGSPDLGGEEYQNLLKYDLIVVVFPEGTASSLVSGHLLRIGSDPMKSGDYVMLSGFGYGDYRGTSYIIHRGASMLYINYTGEKLERSKPGVHRYGVNLVNDTGAYHYKTKNFGAPNHDKVDVEQWKPGLFSGGTFVDSGAPLVNVSASPAYISAMMSFEDAPENTSDVRTSSYYLRLDSPELARLFKESVQCDSQKMGPCATEFVHPGLYKVAPVANSKYSIESHFTRDFSLDLSCAD